MKGKLKEDYIVDDMVFYEGDIVFINTMDFVLDIYFISKEKDKNSKLYRVPMNKITLKKA